MKSNKRGDASSDTAGQWSRVIWLDRQVRAGAHPSVEDLQEEFGIARRTAFNSIAYLRDSLGAPLRYSKSRRGYYYEDPAYGLPSVFLSEGELLALVLAQQVSRGYLGTPVEAPLRAAIEKLARYLPDQVSLQLEELAQGYHIAGGHGPEVPFQLLADSQRAVRDRRLMRILYYTASRGETREREIEPHFLSNVAGDWMLVAWDRWRDADRSFLLARVREHQVLENGFKRRPELQPDTYSTHLFLTHYGREPYEVALRFDSYKARWIRERTWHPSQTVEERPDGGLDLRMTVAGEGDLLRWILGHGGHVEVLSPAWLREQVAHECRSAAALYG